MADQGLLFLCTGNSCRSQMAEGFANKYAGHEWEIFSAGLRPQGINPMAIRVMQEQGIDITGQSSKSMETEEICKMDVIVTLCGGAREACPITPPGIKRIHWPLTDPAQATGSEEEILRVFRQVRDEIEERVQTFFSQQ